MEERAKEEKDKSVLISPHYFFIVLVGLLLVFSVVQSFQISSMKDDLKGNDGLIDEGSSGKQVVLRSPAKQAAPAMVGGC